MMYAMPPSSSKLDQPHRLSAWESRRARERAVVDTEEDSVGPGLVTVVRVDEVDAEEVGPAETLSKGVGNDGHGAVDCPSNSDCRVGLTENVCWFVDVVF